MMKLLLIDASNLLFQMFFGMPSRIVNRNGKAVHGTLGFVGALLKIIRMTKPTHVAVLFDGERENDVRVSLDSGYKANRPDFGAALPSESPFSQLSDIYAALEWLGVKYAEATVCETDDWIAAYVAKYRSEAEIVISSFDSDYFQLLNDRVSVLRYRGLKTTVCTPAFLKDRFGIEPCQYADFKSLTGDSSDNIRGAEKIGPKTAARLLKEYRTLEEILANMNNIQPSSVRTSLSVNADKLRTNYQIIKLNGDAALPFLLQECAYEERGATTREVLTGIGILP